MSEKHGFKPINWEALKTKASTSHLRMSKSQFDNILKLLRLGHSWADICDIAGTLDVMHSVSWYVARNPSSHADLLEAIASGQSISAQKTLAKVQLSDDDDNATKVQRDKLLISLLKNGGGGIPNTQGGGAIGIGQRLGDARRKSLKSLDIVEDAELVEPVQSGRGDRPSS